MTIKQCSRIAELILTHHQPRRSDSLFFNEEMPYTALIPEPKLECYGHGKAIWAKPLRNLGMTLATSVHVWGHYHPSSSKTFIIF